MTNSIDAHVEFSYRGETYSLSVTIDLDPMTEPDASPPPVHEILARKNGIDTYSYLYEVMQEEEIRFDNAHGLAADFLVDGAFDMKAFFTRIREKKIHDLLQTIVAREMGIDDLAQHPALRNALSQAYFLGQNAAKPGA